MRLYGRDFKERLENYGLAVQVFCPQAILAEKMIHKIKVLDDDIVLICSIE